MTLTQVNEIYENLKTGLKALELLNSQGLKDEVINDSGITGTDIYQISLKLEDIIQSIDESGTIFFNDCE